MAMNKISIVSGAALLALTATAAAAPAASHYRHYVYEQGRHYATYDSGMYTGRSVGYTQYKVGGTSKR
jgi:hypothetical protein